MSLMSCPGVESQGCCLIPLSYFLSVFLPSPTALSGLSFICLWSILLTFLPRKFSLLLLLLLLLPEIVFVFVFCMVLVEMR